MTRARCFGRGEFDNWARARCFGRGEFDRWTRCFGNLQIQQSRFGSNHFPFMITLHITNHSSDYSSIAALRTAFPAASIVQCSPDSLEVYFRFLSAAAAGAARQKYPDARLVTSSEIQEVDQLGDLPPFFRKHGERQTKHESALACCCCRAHVRLSHTPRGHTAPGLA